MVEDKVAIILEEGVPVKIRDRENVLMSETKALIGKATKSTLTEISLEYHRMLQFTPTTPITNGMFIENSATADHYLAVALMKEVVDSEHCANIVRAVVCNTEMTLHTYQEEADEKGNWTRGMVAKFQNIPVHISRTVYSLEMTKLGALPYAEFQLLSPSLPVDETDVVSLNINGSLVNYKVNTVDYLTYPNLCVIGLTTDTREAT